MRITFNLTVYSSNVDAVPPTTVVRGTRGIPLGDRIDSIRCIAGCSPVGGVLALVRALAFWAIPSLRVKHLVPGQPREPAYLDTAVSLKSHVQGLVGSSLAGDRSEARHQC